MNENHPIGAVLVTHGQLGDVLLNVACGIVGEVKHIQSVSIDWNDDVEEAKQRISAAVDKVKTERGVIILTDMFGGTPSNLSLSFQKKGEIDILTGVNLPMVIKLASQSGQVGLDDLAALVCEQGRSQITIASELLGE